MLIRTVCHTNLDDYKKQEWPSSMCSPKVGDSVKTKSGLDKLKIVYITHCEDKEGIPYLEIELYH
jgi:hypothetical protein